MTKKVRVNFFLPETLDKAARALAERRGSPLSGVFRDALLRYVREELQKEKRNVEP